MTGNELVEQRLQEHLRAMRTGETLIPLERDEALRWALRLRAEGVTYGDIARVMGVYHGLWWSDARWRDLCRAAGAPAKHFANRLRVAPAPKVAS